MSLKFSVDVSGMDEVKRQLARACGRAENVVAQQVMKDTAPFVPALTGSLTERTRVVGNEVIYAHTHGICISEKLWWTSTETAQCTLSAKMATKLLDFRKVLNFTQQTEILYSTQRCTRRRNRIGLTLPKRKTWRSGCG